MIPDDIPPTRPTGRPKKKVDIEAVTSPLNRIPGLDLPTVRDLLDLGFRHVHELQGRAPEVLHEQIRHAKPATPADRLARLRLAVYFAETPDPDRARLHPSAWTY